MPEDDEILKNEQEIFPEFEKILFTGTKVIESPEKIIKRFRQKALWRIIFLQKDFLIYMDNS